MLWFEPSESFRKRKVSESAAGAFAAVAEPDFGLIHEGGLL
jgi:hypothetical protein